MVLMDRLRLMRRRDVVGGAAASAASLVLTGILPSLLPRPAHAQSAARIVVIGGGFGGASCARALRRIDPRLQVTPFEPNRTCTACPFSNEVIAGLRELNAQQFGYDRVSAQGVTVIAQAAAKIDAQKRMIYLADGQSLGYERLVLAPGIDIRFEALPGYDETASCLEGGRTDGAVAQADRGHGRRRPCRARGTRGPLALPAGAIRARQSDRALSEDKKAALQGAHPRCEGHVPATAPVRECL